MQYNKLGDSGLLVSELSYGAWVTFQVCSPGASTRWPRADALTLGSPCCLPSLRWQAYTILDPQRMRSLQNEGQVSKEEAAVEIMKACYDGGINFFDNAEGAPPSAPPAPLPLRPSARPRAWLPNHPAVCQYIVAYCPAWSPDQVTALARLRRLWAPLSPSGSSGKSININDSTFA